MAPRNVSTPKVQNIKQDSLTPNVAKKKMVVKKSKTKTPLKGKMFVYHNNLIQSLRNFHFIYYRQIVSYCPKTIRVTESGNYKQNYFNYFVHI